MLLASHCWGDGCVVRSSSIEGRACQALPAHTGFAQHADIGSSVQRDRSCISPAGQRACFYQLLLKACSKRCAVSGHGKLITF